MEKTWTSPEFVLFLVRIMFSNSDTLLISPQILCEKWSLFFGSSCPDIKIHKLNRIIREWNRCIIISTEATTCYLKTACMMSVVISKTWWSEQQNQCYCIKWKHTFPFLTHVHIQEKNGDDPLIYSCLCLTRNVLEKWTIWNAYHINLKNHTLPFFFPKITLKFSGFSTWVKSSQLRLESFAPQGMVPSVEAFCAFLGWSSDVPDFCFLVT